MNLQERALADLRHLYGNMMSGTVRDSASAKRIAVGLLSPAIQALENSTPPTEAPGDPAFIQRMAQVALDACRDPAPAEPLVTFRKPQNRDEVIVLLRMASGLVTEINDQFGALLAQPAPATETDGELLARLGTDAMKWTEEFCKRTPSVYPDKMLGWFANAIEAGRSAGVRQHSVEYWRSIAVALGAPAE